MSELKTNLEQILQEKTTKLIPENIKRKVEIFDVTGTDGDVEVEELQAKIIKTRQEIADTRRDLENSAATVTGTGENVTLNQTAEATFKKLGVGGNTEQIQYTGKNLLPFENTTQTINGVTITHNKDGSITLNGTSTENIGYYLFTGAKNIIDTNKNYVLSTKNEMPNKSFFRISNASDSNIFVNIASVAENVNQRKYVQFNGSQLQNENVTCVLFIYPNYTFNNYTVYPMLEEGTSMTEYEPYVRSELQAHHQTIHKK